MPKRPKEPTLYRNKYSSWPIQHPANLLDNGYNLKKCQSLDVAAIISLTTL
jgi:hypothetical protein